MVRSKPLAGVAAGVVALAVALPATCAAAAPAPSGVGTGVATTQDPARFAAGAAQVCLLLKGPVQAAQLPTDAAVAGALKSANDFFGCTPGSVSLFGPSAGT
jgi:hypothetical protein